MRMATYPPYGTPDWDDDLKAYIDDAIEIAADDAAANPTDSGVAARVASGASTASALSAKFTENLASRDLPADGAALTASIDNLAGPAALADETSEQRVTLDGLYGPGSFPALLKYPAIQGTILTSWQSGHGAVTSGASAENLNDTSDFIFGTQSARFNCSATNGATAQLRTVLGSAVDVTGKVLRLWAKLPTIGGISTLALSVSDADGVDAGWTQARTSTIPASSLGQGSSNDGDWLPFDFTFSRITDSNGGPALTAITGLRVLAVSAGTGAVPVQVNRIEMFDRSPIAPQGIVTLTLDDSYLSHFTIARPILDVRGYRATLFPIQNRIGADNALYMSEDQVRSLYESSRWDIGMHATSIEAHEQSLVNMTDAELQAEIAACKAWNLERGYPVSSYAYPNGQTNRAVAREMDTKVAVCRMNTGVNSHNAQTPSAPMRVRAHGATSSNLADLQTAVTECAATGSWLIITLHDIVASGASGLSMNTADFQSLVDHIAASGAKVRTMEDVLRSAQSVSV